MTTEERLGDCLREAGAAHWGGLPTEEIPFDPQVRTLCEGNVCRCYGTTWACPPAVGTLEDCRKRCLSYRRILVFSAAYPLDGSFDLEGMRRGMLAFKTVCDHLAEAAAPFLPDHLLLSNESCFRCAACTYPHSPCRFPRKLFPSIEGYGILVGTLAKRAGIPCCAPGAVTYFGGLLFS